MILCFTGLSLADDTNSEDAVPVFGRDIWLMCPISFCIFATGSEFDGWINLRDVAFFLVL